MTRPSVLAPPRRPPEPADPDRAERGLERWLDQAGREENADLAAFMRDMAAPDTPGRAVLDAVFGNSPFLTTCVLREPAWMRRLVEEDPEAARVAALEEAEVAAATEDDQARVMRVVRVAKRRTALTTALADILGLWSLAQVTGALSTLAEVTLDLCLGHLLRRLHAKGDLVLATPETPPADCGLFMLGMGKLGARELNYSSDIDLIVLFDEAAIDYRGRLTAREAMVRLTRDVVRMMEERTGDGYVFRCDLRLRPDPGSTPLALSTDAAEQYYETLGQNWERAAMIKARPVAGDRVAGLRFLDAIRPFVWRRSLDFNAIQDIHSIKRQIHAQRGHAVVAVEGHNLKLGRGGIREIEFFAQTQQLIWGGREPRLRARETTVALRALTERGLVNPGVRDDLLTAYEHLRRIEHRLQMIDDEQTQTLPNDKEKLRALAIFLGYDGIKDFALSLKDTLMTVQNHYADLFEDQPTLSDSEGNLVFTGGEDDPETLRTLTDLGFSNPHGVASTIRGWHHGRYRALRGARARERLTELMPSLIRALAATANPDGALLRFDSFLNNLPAGAQMFALFAANPHLLSLLAEIMGDAPRLAEHLARNPRVLDAVLEPGFVEAPPTLEDLRANLHLSLRDARVFEDVLDLCRRWANDQKFQVGVRTLRGDHAPGDAARTLADVADVVLSALLERVEDHFAETHGRLPGGAVSVVALGKLGGQEMTPTSDLDLIIVYDVPSDVDQSNGRKPLAPTVYYTRLVQRFINAITANTAQGRLYEVDMRLRPSGNKGPLATSLEAFRRYQAEGAWTWEHQALTRARVVAGPVLLNARVAEVIRDTLRRPRDPALLAKEVADMRTRMAAEHPGRGFWDIKHRRGGLVDVEFLAQYLQLLHARTHPEIVGPNTAEGLRRAGEAGLLPAADATFLSEAHGRWLGVQSMIRHTMDGVPEDTTLPPGLKARLVSIWPGARDFDDLKTRVSETAARVHALYERIILDQPGGDGGATDPPP